MIQVSCESLARTSNQYLVPRIYFTIVIFSDYLFVYKHYLWWIQLYELIFIFLKCEININWLRLSSTKRVHHEKPHYYPFFSRRKPLLDLKPAFTNLAISDHYGKPKISYFWMHIFHSDFFKSISANFIFVEILFCRKRIRIAWIKHVSNKEFGEN